MSSPPSSVISESPGKDSTPPNKSYAQAVGVATHSNELSNFGFPLYLHTQMSSSSGGTNTPLSSCSSCHELNNILDAKGVSILSSNELRKKLRRVQELLKTKRITRNHFQSKFADSKSFLERTKKPDEKLSDAKKELNAYFEKAQKLLDYKRKAQSDLSHLLQNTLYDWHARNPECKTAIKIEHMNSKVAKLQQEETQLREKIDSLETEMKNIGGGRGNKERRNLVAQDSRTVNSIRSNKERLSATVRKRNELKFFVDKWQELADVIKDFDTQYKELQMKIRTLKDNSDPLRNAIELRDKVHKCDLEIGRLECEERLLLERKDHIIEQRRLSKLALENDSTPIKPGDSTASSSSLGTLTRPPSYLKHRRDSGSKQKLETAAHLLLTLKSARDQHAKRNTLHHELLARLVDFGLDDVFLSKGSEPCIEFLEKYLKNSPPNCSPSKADNCIHKDSGMKTVASSTEERSQNDRESGYRSLSTGDKTLHGVSDEIIEALSQHQATSFSATPLTEADTSSVGMIDSSSQAPQPSQAEDVSEEFVEEAEEPFARTFSEQLFTQEMSAVTLQQISKESETKAPYISDWMASKSISSNLITSVVAIGEQDSADNSNIANKEVPANSTDFQDLEEYPPLKPEEDS